MPTRDSGKAVSELGHTLPVVVMLRDIGRTRFREKLGKSSAVYRWGAYMCRCLRFTFVYWAFCSKGITKNNEMCLSTPPVVASKNESRAYANSSSCTSACLPLPFTYLLPSPRCGQSLARLGAEVVGVDPSPENVAVASAHAKGDPLTRTIRFEATTAEELETRGTQNTAPAFWCPV